MNRHRQKKGDWKEQPLAVTLTYKQHNYIDPKQQFQDTICDIQYRLARCSDEYYIHPECTVDGNIHYHLILFLKDRIKWYKNFIPYFKKKGFMRIKPMFSAAWVDYCNKDTEMMEDILGVKLPITKENRYKITKETEESLISELDGIAKYFKTS